MRRLAVHGAEGGEIVFAEQRLRGAVHRLRVERPPLPASGTGGRSAGRTGAVEDAVAVAARARREARMEIVGDRHAPAHRRRVGGRREVAPSIQPRGSRRGVAVEVHDLAGRMHAGIGAAGADDVDRCIGDEGQRRLPAPACTVAVAPVRLPGLLSRCQPRNSPPSYSTPSA